MLLGFVRELNHYIFITFRLNLNVFNAFVDPFELRKF